MSEHVTDTVAVDKRTPGIKSIDPLLRPLLATLYTNRTARLRQLAAGHAEADYLKFIAGLVDEQRALLVDQPLKHPSGVISDINCPVRAGLELEQVRAYWLSARQTLLAQVSGAAPEFLRRALEPLRQADEQTSRRTASLLLEGRSGEVDAANALFTWAALSLTAAQYAGFVSIERHAQVAKGENFLCPLCGSAPAGSLIMNGDRAGLRYLHCALCETRWHVVRAKCSNCASMANLDYLSLDTATTSVKAESCGDCSGYLKAFYREHDEHVEVCADDLATLQLDVTVSEHGYERTGISPFAFQALPSS
ncbi:formate dehydrogenase accessory protein FdhE [Paraburkholderia hospita]|uniref:Protein FdhE homolog n=1 Tax=Paraburkholderia hospita TaxID=169430 RepID=A0ABP2PTB3_9BURK|nr:formate dehydrogenase accessory protein FdhE [Paraburkholderia hospita]EIN00471.1 formate dehydrogenase accessory protein FdhE [Paraburkholderia hospita]OUL68186.1 formate dehydrogenase accessory protein FdhE [Paraburkholderia hospita]